MDKKDTYQFIIDHFKEERIRSRYDWLSELMDMYIKREEIEDDVYVSGAILDHVVIDYFVDIYRLKEFQEIEKVHESKIYAYTIAWTLRHKPIQVNSNSHKDHLYINEKFAADLLKSYLFDKPKDVSILQDQREAYDNFGETLLYYFKYRDYSAKSIEMIILGFQAGRAYQYSADKAE